MVKMFKALAGPSNASKMLHPVDVTSFTNVNRLTLMLFCGCSLQVSFDGGDIFAMADSIPVVRQIDRQLLNCGICLERYKSPKVLPCLHTFCQTCLAEYIPAVCLSVCHLSNLQTTVHFTCTRCSSFANQFFCNQFNGGC